MVDEHHLVEDVGVVSARRSPRALGKQGISRYGFEMLTMDEVLGEVAIDFGGGRTCSGASPCPGYGHLPHRNDRTLLQVLQRCGAASLALQVSRGTPPV